MTANQLHKILGALIADGHGEKEVKYLQDCISPDPVRGCEVVFDDVVLLRWGDE